MLQQPVKMGHVKLSGELQVDEFEAELLADLEDDAEVRSA